MAYLHENREEFINAVNLSSSRYGILPTVAEKDYYVTMILRGLSVQIPFVVFKGGTSLSKCHKAIKRFSEDIDVSIDKKITSGQKRSLKNAIKGIAGDLGLLIPNIDEIGSTLSYNRYILQYDSVIGERNAAVDPAVILETSFAEISFPTDILAVHSYIGDMVADEAPDAMHDFLLDPFKMKVQRIDRTMVDKVFAICDYYLQEKTEKHSRHIYDIYKLLPKIPQTEEFKALVKEVRLVRAENKICPSAKKEVNVSKLLLTIIQEEAYKKDYELITSQILEEKVKYETAIDAIRRIAESGVFE